MSSGIAGSIGDPIRLYTFRVTADTGEPSAKKSTAAIPPIATNTGAPKNAAARTTSASGHR